MAKAQVLETVERDGVRVLVYDNGMERNADTGAFIKPPPHTLITAQNSTVFVRRRQEKAAALLRSRIAAAHNASMPSPVTSSAGAFAEAGAMLYEQIVLNSEAYPRDRTEAWEKLGKYAGVLPADVRRSDDGATAQAAAAGAAAGSAAAVLKFLTDVAQQQRQSADVIDIRSEDEGKD